MSALLGACGAGWLRDDVAMSGDQQDRGRAVRRAVQRPRAVRRPVTGPGPLGELKKLLYQLYVEAGQPTLEHIAAEVAADDDLKGAPKKDRIDRCLRSPGLPANQLDVVAVATVLAREARWDPDDAAARARELWVQARMSEPAGRARMSEPAGRPVGEFTDPFALEVHRPIEVAVRPGAAELPVLPAYIPREHDRRLAEAVSRAEGGNSSIAVLVGGSSTGKTRACWEAVHALPPGWRLWHPIFPGRAEAFLAGLERVGPRTVVWLNEAQFYLLTGDPLVGERVAAGLRDLLRDPQRGPVLVLGTIWPRYWQPLTAPPARDGQDPHAHARELLAGAGIEVPGTFTGPALAALAAAARARSPAGCRPEGRGRAGYPVPGRRACLAGAVPHRAAGRQGGDRRGDGRPDARPRPRSPSCAAGNRRARVPHRPAMGGRAGEDWLEQALAYTAAPCRGARGPLTRIRPRPGQPAPASPATAWPTISSKPDAPAAGQLPAGLTLGCSPRARGAGKPPANRRPSTGPGGCTRYAFSFYAAPPGRGWLGPGRRATGRGRDDWQRRSPSASGRPRPATPTP